MGGEKFKMKNQELKKMLHELNEKLGKILEEQGDDLEKAITDRISDAHNESAYLSVKKDRNGQAEVHMEGTTMGMLITLAGLEKAVLEKTHVPSAVWEMIKETVGVKEAN